MSKLQKTQRFFPSGWNGLLLHVRATVSGVICVPGSSNAVAKARGIRRILFVLVVFALLAESVALAGQANVFVYHRFNDSRYPSTNISLQDFRNHLELLRKHDFSVLTLGDIVARLQTGANLPERCAAITVDDAFHSFFTDGWPLLKEFGYPATLFVSTDSVGGGDYLSWQELKRLADDGVEIGNHSAAHTYMLDNFKRVDWHQEVKDDLERSQAAFFRNLGYSPSLFAYPYGEYSPELIDLVKQVGFVAAFGQQSGVIATGSDLYSLPRFPMGGDYTNLDGFRSKLFMKHLPLEVVSPKSPVIIEENPPRLTFYLKESDALEGTLKCFVAGQTKCQLNILNKDISLYEVRAESPLKGRRSKYTLTASDSSGRTWFWFSQLWVAPRLGAVSDNSVAR